jgi:hypothetical protein
MKKLIAAICFVMLASLVLPLAVSADGALLFNETFDKQDPNNWMWDSTAFFVEDGVLKGWSEAKVHQSKFLTSEGGQIKYKECAVRVDCTAFDDGGEDVETHRVGLWFADYIDPYATDDPDSWIIYKPLYNFEQGVVELEMEFTGDAAQAFLPADLPQDSVVGRYAVPADQRAQIGGDWFSLGIRVNAGVVSLFYNDVKLVDFPAYRGTLTATQRPSPILLLNGGCYCGFDNIKVSTANYNLFNESDTPAPAPAPADTVKTITTEKVVVGTDSDGNEITEIVTKEVVMPAAQTGTNTNPGNSTATGDMAVIVIAVMVVAIGAAVAVKKLGAR